MPSKLKGKVFEYFMTKLLEGCGFTPVLPDGLIVYKGGAGLMLQGLGQSHNADVLMTPPMQTPFYYPTNLLVECKWHNKPLGLPFVRNVLGLREDINNFDIVTPEILKARKDYHSMSPKLYPFDRYIYQVALASVSGFTRPAIEFAQVHRIPLISFAEGEIFEPLRDVIKYFDTGKFSYSDLDDIFWGDYNNDVYEIARFFESVEELKEQVRIGIMENGTILFLCCEDDCISDTACNEFTLYWGYEKNSWILTNDNTRYYFELPKEMMKDWINESRKHEKDFYQRMKVLNIQKKYFPKIYLLDTEKECVQALNINTGYLNDRYSEFFGE